jgi:predicted alpha/beta-fold hydrolase
MKQRILATGLFTPADLASSRNLYEIDDRITAPAFGFGNADNYYATQSSKNFLDRIRVPALIIAAKDDTFIPFEMYSHPAFVSNPNLTLVAPDHGGHLGFLARGPQRFWADQVTIDFLTATARALTLTSR